MRNGVKGCSQIKEDKNGQNNPESVSMRRSMVIFTRAVSFMLFHV